MKIYPGDILIAKNGNFYRVVGCTEGIVTLMRLNGYTLFSCSVRFAETAFRTTTPSMI